ncbi:ribosome hibernation-promoting factor, HPF/YfiA family [Acidipropionibacterium virtanenii]|uniref:Ribosome hibernation promotion factor n=1 Tax=Acidipropionibacterium virtanenii TaxID=2057246 RepID=A0A344UTM5_9ACTN|nr:ribosome-associated translation inhibitor RaiA [Acidipropionibacterium virtanenii]AXE38623.1 Ribosome hibernation promotion factor [Acidipropionibacterium virtanenii]
MDVIVSGRHCKISDDIRAQVEDRISSVEKWRDRVQRVEVVFTVQDTKGSRDQAITCEITLRSRGPVVRAVGQAADKMVAFDKAAERLRAQLTKAADRRRSRRGLRVSQVLDVPAADVTGEAPDIIATRKIAGDVEVTGDGPLYVKEKVFPAAPLTLAQALDEMELVGHDFFLYLDSETKSPSVVYRRRKGYNFGVIHLNVDGSES